jgi:adenylosuccinate synthase
MSEMKTAKVVIGANFGDEGKGLVTDYLSHSLGRSTVVVRFNGGAQAGHTVNTPEGIRHIFGHFGSGTLAGCRTHLSKFFIVNPILFWKERQELTKKGFQPRVTVDPSAIVTSYYDMLLNQISERKLGRKASCGVGINETVTRSEHDEFVINVRDLEEGNYQKKIIKILNEWVPYRLKELSIDKSLLTSVEAEVLTPDSDRSKALLSIASDEAVKFISRVIAIPDSYLSEVDNLVFEGAQGLLLDQDHKNFPWVTRSSTGLTNIIQLFEEADLTYIDVYYVTRAYLTRHGDGPLSNSSDFPIYPKIVDETNITNRYQGSIRFAPLDTEEFLKEVAADRCKAIEQDIPSYYNVAITCLDQVPQDVQDKVISSIKGTGYPLLTSYGPKRTDIKRS